MGFRKILTHGLCLILFCTFPNIYAGAAKISSDTALQNAVLVHINEYRQQHGLPKLTMDNNMVREAQQHSFDMATHRMPFGHQGFIKRISHLRARIKNAGAGAENVAYNYKDASTVVQQWVKSPGHKRNIIGNYNLTGVGIARDKQGRIYYTQLFIRTTKQPSHQVARRPNTSFSFAGISWHRRNA